MALRQKNHIRTLQKRGSGLCVVVPGELLAQLGWNRDDALRVAIVAGSLVMTRVDLPKIPDLRRTDEAVASET